MMLFYFGSILLIVLTLATIKKQDLHENKDRYTILKTDSIEHIYIVYAEKNDSVFKILSKKTDVIDCQIIKVGCRYKLELKSWFLPEEFHIKMRMTGIKYEGMLINIERDSIVSDLFTTVNLKGLCYTAHPHEDIPVDE